MMMMLFQFLLRLHLALKKIQLDNVKFGGNESRPLSIIDTIGFDDPKNDTDADIIADLVTTLKHYVDFINTFVIAVNGQNPRLDGSLLAMIKILEGMFGEEMWKQTIVVFTRLPMNTVLKTTRKITSKKEDSQLAESYLREVESHFGHSKGLQYLFMDAYYAVLDEQLNETSGTDAFMKAMEDLWKNINQNPDLSTDKVK